jgi:polyferredoxin
MGIDIREGQQMECITCALCIDACDDVMARIGKPRGLIDYIALEDEAAERAGAPPASLARHVFRPRTLVYTALWALVGLGLVVALFVRSEIGLSVAPVRNPTFVTLSDGAIRNAYILRLRNQTGAPVDLALSLDGDGLRLTLEGAGAGNAVTVAADRQAQIRAYVTAAPGSAAADSVTTPLRIWATAPSGARAMRDTTFHGKAEP